MNILIILLIYEKLDKNEESINFHRLLQTEKVDYDCLKKFIIENNIAEINDEYQSIKNRRILYLKNIYGTGDNIILKVNNNICLKILINKELLLLNVQKMKRTFY
jgi:hypothetical protein